MIQARNHKSNPGFTLIEMVISIALVGIVSSALMSAFLLSLQAIPSADDPAITAAKIDNAFEFLMADAMLASAASTDGTNLTLTVPDQTGDSAPETVVYALDAGNFIRTINGELPRTLAGNIATSAFTITSENGRATRVSASLVTLAGQAHNAGIELLARPQ